MWKRVVVNYCLNILRLFQWTQSVLTFYTSSARFCVCVCETRCFYVQTFLSNEKRQITGGDVCVLTLEPLRKFPMASSVARILLKVWLEASCSMPSFRSNRGSAISCRGRHRHSHLPLYTLSYQPAAGALADVTSAQMYSQRTRHRSCRTSSNG